MLDGKVAFVTGAAQGIGLAVAQAYLAQGGRVALADVAAEPLAKAVAGLGSKDSALAVPLDVGSESQTDAAVATTVKSFGQVDIVVVNAGILLLKHVVDMQLAEWRKVLEVNLTGAFITARAFARQMVHQGHGGRIIFTSSLFGLRGGMENAAYSASKFGMIGLMQCLAAELAKHHILVNAVCPGQMDTAMMRSLFRDRAALTGRTESAVEAALLSRIAMGRLGDLNELAGTYVFLASDLSSYCTGQSFTIDGGWQVT